MKKTFRLMGVLALVVVLGFALSCGDGGGGGDGGIVKSTSGQLTITGINSDSNGMFVYAATDGSSTVPLIAAADIVDEFNLKGGLIVDGTVTLKVWTIGENSFNNFNSTSFVTFNINFYNEEVINYYDALVYGDVGYVDFINGIGTIDLTPPGFEETSGVLTLSGFDPSFNGKYVRIQGINSYNPSEYELFGVASITSVGLYNYTVDGGEIIDGSVTLKVWEKKGNVYKDFNGNKNDVWVSIFIYEDEEINYPSGTNYIKTGYSSSVNFITGSGSGPVVITP